MRLGRIFASMAAIGACVVMADEIKLADGSVINGSVQQVFEGNVLDCWKYDLRRQWIAQEVAG